MLGIVVSDQKFGYLKLPVLQKRCKACRSSLQVLLHGAIPRCPGWRLKCKGFGGYAWRASGACVSSFKDMGFAVQALSRLPGELDSIEVSRVRYEGPGEFNLKTHAI